MSELDDIVSRFLDAFEIPGAGIAVVRPDHPALARSYGVRTLGEPEPVDLHTQFAIASNSKAFLAACLALLVDEGVLGWDDPVVKHLPEFRMQDPAVTAMMTVRDLLVHRSGLPLGAGDLMQYPRSDHTHADVLAALPYFKLKTGFRSSYAYDNCLYIVAGMLLERVSGLDWANFAAQRLFAPLWMEDAVAVPSLARTDNHAGRHIRLGPPVIGMGPLERFLPDESDVIGPAGGINASLSDMLPWLAVQLRRGVLPDGLSLWSAAQAEEMWTPRTIVSSGPGPTADQPQRSVMQGYALGWGVNDYRGRRMLTHGGGLAGQASRTTLLPDHGIGFVILTNSGDTEPVSGLRYALLDHLLGVEGYDWIAATKTAIAAGENSVRALVGDGDFTAPSGQPGLPLERYAGRYRDPWYGDIVVAREGGHLTIDFTRTPVLKSRLDPFGADAFRTRFPRGTGEDAVISFAVEGGAITGVTVKALSPLADFSFDYHDLNFVPVEA